RKLKQDAEGGFRRAARADELDRAVEIDVVPGGELHGRLVVEAAPLELLGAPALDPLLLGFLDMNFGRRHQWVPLIVLMSLFGKTSAGVYPIPRKSELLRRINRFHTN